jgi:hypothetical protein
MASHSLTAVPGVREQLVHESVAMLQYALASGMRVSADTATLLEQARTEPADSSSDVAAIAKVHDQLSKLVAPATPRALLLMGADHSAQGLKSMLGPVGLVRRMMIAAVASMALFIGVSLTPYVNETLSVQNSSGLALFATELFWLSAAAMGASFAMLMQVSGFVVKRNYDPRYEPSYWIKFFLGVMAGFILVTLVPVDGVKDSTLSLAQPTVAMLGGFSASAVFRILTRLVDAVESLFRGDSKDLAARAESDANTRVTQETSQVKLGFAAQVVQLQQDIATGADSAALTSRLREMLTALVPDSGLEPSAPTATPAAATIALPGVSVVSDAPAADAPEAALAAG